MVYRILIKCSFLTAAMAAGLVFGHQAAGAADISYKGKILTVLIGYSPGGGTDATGRLLGKYLVKYLPGKPRLVVRNMPGGGGITAMNYFAREAKSDGTTIALGAAAQADPLVFRSKSSHYDASKFRYIGGVNRGGNVLIIRKDAVARIKDPKGKPIVMGAQDGSRTGMIMAMWGREIAGWNLKWVIGYPGTPALMLALQRGEIDMTSTAQVSLIRELIQAGKHELWVQSGNLVGGKYEASNKYKGTPVFANVIRPQLKTERQRKAFEYWEGTSALDKFLILPQKAQDPVLKVHRAAFRKVAKDSEFLDQGRKSISSEFAVIPPEDQEKLALQVATADQGTMAFIDSIRVKQKLPSFLKKKKVKQTQVSTELDAVQRGGRVLRFKVKGKAQRARVSSANTDVMINGKMDSRSKLKPGMSCKISYPGDNKTAAKVDCKSK